MRIVMCGMFLRFSFKFSEIKMNLIKLKSAKAVWEDGMLIVMYEPVDDDGQNIVSTRRTLSLSIFSNSYLLGGQKSGFQIATP